MDTFEAIQLRRSVRSYKKERAIPQADVLKIIDAGRLAPTARNDQPWEFVVVEDTDTRRDLADLADHGRFIAEAPVCIAVFAEPTTYYVEDGSAATTQMLLAATALGYGTCWVAGDKKAYAEEIRTLLGAPERLKLVALIAVGHSTDTPAAPKRGLDEVLHWDGFGRRPAL